MDEFDVDVSLGEVLRWLKDDDARAAPTLWVRASKEYEVPAGFDARRARLSEEADLGEVVVRGVMEAWPRRGRPGWRLRLSFEDVVGLEPGAGDEDYENEDDLSLEAFEELCVRLEKGELQITVAAEDDAAKARFDRWLARRRPHRTASHR